MVRNTLTQNIDLSAGSDGRVYDVAVDGTLVRATPGAWDWAPAPVASTAARSDGSQYVYLTTGDLFLRTPAGVTGPGAAVLAYFGHMKGFGVRSDGNAYLWNDAGNVLLNTPTQNVDFGKVYGTFIGFSVRADGTAYLEQANGHVVRNTLTQNIDLSTGSDGRVYDVGTDGSLISATPGMWDWSHVSSTQVQSRGTRSDGNQYVWLNDGDLFLQNSTQVIAGFGHMKGFGMRSDGNAYLWNDAGNVLLNTPTQNVDFGKAYGTTFIGFSVRADGTAYLEVGERARGPQHPDPEHRPVGRVGREGVRRGDRWEPESAPRRGCGIGAMCPQPRYRAGERAPTATSTSG